MSIDATLELATPAFVKNLEDIEKWTALLAAADIATASEVIVEWANSQSMLRRSGHANPAQALSEKAGNCVSSSLIVSGLASLCVNLESGILIVGSETVNASHCMSSITDRTSGISVVIDNFFTAFTDENGNDKKSLRFKQSSNTIFREGVFGGMKTALKLLDDRSRAIDDQTKGIVELDGSEDEYLSLWLPSENRFTKTIVTGFFGANVARIADYFSQGMVSDTANQFLLSARQFSSKPSSPIYAPRN